MTGPLWLKTIDPNSTSPIVSHLLFQMKLAGVQEPHLRQVLFALAFMSVGVQQMVDLNRREFPDATISIVPNGQAGKTTNLLLEVKTPQAQLQNGVKISLADVLFIDWERPQAGLRPAWASLLSATATPETAKDLAQATGGLAALMEVLLNNGLNQPLVFRAKFNLLMATCPDQAEREKARQQLLTDFPEMGLRHQQFVDDVPTRQEINKRFAGMPFKSAKGEHHA